MMFSPENLQAIWLTLRLATTATLLLLLIGTPLEWWLSGPKSWLRGPVAAFVDKQIVLRRGG
ncbi:MAG: molybdate ABC transporter permease subunit, partial [Gammaproteobacteria bacterium]|nr:molybdate ABC transporter permease subunit [Gammaproteobacteria bacterium]